MKSRILSCFLIFALCISTLSACGSDTAPSDHSPSSSLQVEISDLQDSTPGETEERDDSNPWTVLHARGIQSQVSQMHRLHLKGSKPNLPPRQRSRQPPRSP